MSLFQVFLLLLIPFALPRTFGRMVGDKRQGYAILGVMATLAAGSIALVTWFEARAAGTATQLGRGGDGGQWVWRTDIRAVRGVDHHDVHRVLSNPATFTPLGGGVPLVNMLLGEVSPGGAVPACTGCSARPSPSSWPGSCRAGRRTTSANGWAGGR